VRKDRRDGGDREPVASPEAGRLGKRARLPALDALRVFEAAARHLSFTRAAEELHVTQAAVSHRIHALEAELGLALFRRLNRRLELTEDGARLVAGVREGLMRMVRAVAYLDRRSESRPLAISVLPSFASRWLVPRLPRFQYAHPEIEVRVLADEHPVKLLDGHGAEVAVRFGLGHYPALAVTPIVADSIGPVSTPLLLARYGIIETVDALLDMPLLYDSAAERDDSGSGWASWLAHIGAPADMARLANGPRMSQAHLAIEAALLGHGVALARTSLVGDDLAAGRLVRVLPQTALTAFRYFFVSRPEVSDRPKIACFRDWLVAEMKRGTRTQGGRLGLDYQSIPGTHGALESPLAAAR